MGLQGNHKNPKFLTAPQVILEMLLKEFMKFSNMFLKVAPKPDLYLKSFKIQFSLWKYYFFQFTSNVSQSSNSPAIKVRNPFWNNENFYHLKLSERRFMYNFFLFQCDLTILPLKCIQCSLDLSESMPVSKTSNGISQECIGT